MILVRVVFMASDMDLCGREENALDIAPLGREHVAKDPAAAPECVGLGSAHFDHGCMVDLAELNAVGFEFVLLDDWFEDFIDSLDWVLASSTRYFEGRSGSVTYSRVNISVAKGCQITVQGLMPLSVRKIST